MPVIKLTLVIIGTLLVPMCEATKLTAEERKKFLNKHNEFRRDVNPAATNMQLMKWSCDLEDSAKKWAENCEFKHSKADGYGENLHWTSAKKLNPEGVVTSWANEMKDYIYNNHTCTKVCGHYTQVVWAKSSQLGCGAHLCPNGYTTVCQYKTPGNYVGAKPYKEGTSCSACPSGYSCNGTMCDDGSSNTIPTCEDSGGSKAVPSLHLIIMPSLLLIARIAGINYMK